MLFSSIEFLTVFLPIVLLGAFAVSRLGQPAMMSVYVFFASIIFYAWYIPAYVPLLFTSILINFGLGELLLRTRSRAVLCGGITFNLVLLGTYKYAGFLALNLAALTGTEPFVTHIALPLAISFCTFQQIAYLVDIARGETRSHGIVSYALFVVFFPHLIAGPIVTHRQLAPELESPRFGRLLPKDVYVGLIIFAIGLAKKTMIADRLAGVADPVFDAAGLGVAPTAVEAWIAAFAYCLQIYFDFSGYSDMAIGLARMFGVSLPVNFNSPYKSLSIIEFWRRWHMTLSAFLRDYLYIPLGGNRAGPSRRTANLMIVMLLGGLWHGAAWTFVVWGALHGAYLIVNHLMLAHAGPIWRAFCETAAGRLVCGGLTFLAVTVAWVFFRSADFATAFAMLAAMAGSGSGLAGVGLVGDSVGACLLLAIGAVVIWGLPNSAELSARLERDEHALAGPVKLPAWAGAVAGVSVFMVYVAGSYEFLYFQF